MQEQQVGSSAPNGQSVRSALLVLGMHRSGTSALTRLLSMTGAVLPNHLMGTAPDNVKGHWESREVTLLNDRILEAVGLSWFDWQPPRWSAQASRERKLIIDDVKRTIISEFGNEDFIVIKDPRICRLASLYLDVLDDLNYRPIPVLAFRHPTEVVRSLKARDSWPEDFSENDALMLWLTHTLEAEKASRHLSRVVVSYDRTLFDWSGVLADVERHGRIKLPKQPEDIRLLVEEFLSPSERHHQVSGKGQGHEPILLGWVRVVYEAMRQLESNPGSTSTHSCLDDVRRQLDSSMPLLLTSFNDRRKVAETAKRGRIAEAAARSEQEQRIIELSSQLAAAHRERDAAIEHWKSVIVTSDATHKCLLDKQQQDFLSSHSWRVTAPLRLASRTVRGWSAQMGNIKSAVAIVGGLGPALASSARIIRGRGFIVFMARLRELGKNGI